MARLRLLSDDIGERKTRSGRKENETNARFNSARETPPSKIPAEKMVESFLEAEKKTGKYGEEVLGMSLLDYFLKRVVTIENGGLSVQGVLTGYDVFNVLIVHTRFGTTIIRGYDTIKET